MLIQNTYLKSCRKLYIHSQYDIPEWVYEANMPVDFPILNLGPWNDDPIVIQAIKEKIDAIIDTELQ